MRVLLLNLGMDSTREVRQANRRMENQFVKYNQKKRAGVVRW
jgi:hypothetical protein